MLSSIMLTLQFLLPQAPSGPAGWSVASTITLPDSTGYVMAVAWDSVCGEAFLVGSGPASLIMMDQSGNAHRIDLSVGSPRWVGLRNDTLFVADSGVNELVILPLSTMRPRSVRWTTPRLAGYPEYYPGMLLSDGSVWVRYRGLENVYGSLPQPIFSRSGELVDTLGILRNTRKLLPITDPNGRVIREYRILHPVDYSSWTAVSANGEWIALLNQERIGGGVDSLELVLWRAGHATRHFGWTIPGVELSSDDLSSVVDDLARYFPRVEQETIRSWGGAAVRSAGHRPPASGLTIGVDGIVWIRRGLGIWGTRHWTVLDPVTGAGTEVILPLDLEVRWASRNLAIGIAQTPEDTGRLVMLKPG